MILRFTLSVGRKTLAFLRHIKDRFVTVWPLHRIYVMTGAFLVYTFVVLYLLTNQ